MVLKIHRTPQGRLVRCNDLESGSEHPIVRELATTPMDLLVKLGLCSDGKRNQSRRLVRSLEPAVGHHGLVAYGHGGGVYLEERSSFSNNRWY